jgi:transposase
MTCKSAPSPWADIPERYGQSRTCSNRFRRWAKIGVRDRIFDCSDGYAMISGYQVRPS